LIRKKGGRKEIMEERRRIKQNNCEPNLFFDSTTKRMMMTMNDSVIGYVFVFGERERERMKMIFFLT
jgi:hypothetical protein